MFGFKLGAVRHALTLRVSFPLCLGHVVNRTMLLALTQTCGFISETHPPTLHCPMPGFARIDSSFSALSWVASGPGLRTNFGLRTSSLRTVGLRTLGRGHACRAPQALHLQARTRIVLPFHISGGQCASCSRRISALEAVQLSAIPVKRTAAASDELCSFEVSCLGSS